MPYFQNRNKLDIYYEEINAEKPLIPLVFVHGYGSSFSLFSYQIKELQNYFKLILFDAEGHGKSDKSSEDLQENLIEKTVLDLETLLDLLEIREPIAIIGHSLIGSGVAIQYAKTYPNKIRFLILLNAGIVKLDSTIRNVFWNLLPQFTRMNFKEIASTSLPMITEKISPFIREAIIFNPNVNREELEKVEEKIVHEINGLIDEEIDPTGITCPTLIIGSELDNFAPAYMSVELKKKIPNSELQIVGMTGHLGLSQRYKSYNKIILDFLKKNRFIVK